MTRYLILGNGAAGATAAEAIRARDARGQITLVNAERYPMYSRPGLAYVIIGEIPDHQVIARQPEWYTGQHIHVLHGTAVKIDTAAHRVQLADGQSLPYDRLLIATGSRAAPLPYPGAALDGVVCLDTLDGTKELLRKVRRAKRAVVVGGGITALEMAEGFAHHNLETHYLLRRKTLWATVFNDTESRLLEERITRHGVTLHFDSEIAEVLGDRRGRVAGVRLKDGQTLSCDLVGAAIGVRPQLDLVHGTPLVADRGLLADEYLETSEPDVFAAGDCAQIWNRWTQSHTLEDLWPVAIAAGRAAGVNMAGGREAFIKGTPFNACLLFGLHITAIGQLGGARDDAAAEVVQHMSRGSSETWATRPHAYASAWSQDGPNTIRLSLGGNRLVGALVVGEQSLADPLRDLIDKQVDIRSLRPYLQEGGPGMAQMIQRFWTQWNTPAPGTYQPMPEVASGLVAR